MGVVSVQMVFKGMGQDDLCMEKCNIEKTQKLNLRNWKEEAEPQSRLKGVRVVGQGHLAF